MGTSKNVFPWGLEFQKDRVTWNMLAIILEM